MHTHTYTIARNYRFSFSVCVSLSLSLTLSLSLSLSFGRSRCSSKITNRYISTSQRVKTTVSTTYCIVILEFSTVARGTVEPRAAWQWTGFFHFVEKMQREYVQLYKYPALVNLSLKWGSSIVFCSLRLDRRVARLFFEYVHRSKQWRWWRSGSTLRWVPTIGFDHCLPALDIRSKYTSVIFDVNSKNASQFSRE